MDIFDKFFKKFAYKFNKGYPDMNNNQDILLLESLLNELDIPFQLGEVKMDPVTLGKPYPPRNELSSQYKDRGEKFLDKILNKEPFELVSGGTVILDPEKSKGGIQLLQNKEYDKLGKGTKLFFDPEGNSYSLTSFKKTSEFGSGSGQGGGAASTTIQESSQSVVNAIAYNVKKSLIDDKDLTSENLKKAISFCEVSSTLDEIIDFVTKQSSWTSTFVETANILYKTYPSSNFEQHRGSTFVDKIYEAFTNAKKENNLSIQSDKWNPADIWLVDKSIIGITFPNNLQELNNKLVDLFSDDLLIGVSLKKLSGGAKLSVYNLDEKDKEGHQYVGYDSRPTNNNSVIEYDGGKITFRTFNFATNFAGEIQGKTAAHGKIGQGAINDILKQNNLPTLMSAKEVQDNLKNQDAQFIKDYFNIYSKLVEAVSLEEFNDILDKKDLNYLVSKYLSLKLTSIINNQNKTIQDEVISDIIRYASSSTKSSSVFIKIS
jgi:hypothetical protein